MVAGDKARSGAIAKVAGCVLLLLAVKAIERQTVVTGGVVHPLAVKASSGSIPAMGESPARAKAGQASGGGTIEMIRG